MRVILFSIILMFSPITVFGHDSHDSHDANQLCHKAADGTVHCHLSEE